jgi:hypothetical protein
LIKQGFEDGQQSDLKKDKGSRRICLEAGMNEFINYGK